MNGFQTFEKLLQTNYSRFFTNKQHGRIPVIFVTSNDTIEEREKGFNLGAADFILKPFIRGELLAAADKILKPENRFKEATVLLADDSDVVRKVPYSSSYSASF